MKPYLTTQGLCQAFNGKPLLDVFKPSKYMKDFVDTFLPQEMFRDKDSSLIHPSGFGYGSGFLILLDTKKFANPSPYNNIKRSFALSIGSSASAYDMNIQKIPIRAGFISKVKVIQSQYQSSQSLSSLTREQRGCR